MSNLTNPNYPIEILTNPYARRNVVNYYRYWSTEAIKADLDTKRTELVVICENFAKDYNIGGVIRASNAFVVSQVWLIGHKKWDRRGAVGMQNYEHIYYQPSLQPLVEKLQGEGYRIVVADNLEGALPVDTYRWAPKTALILGAESVGVSPIALDCADDVVYIRQYGSVRSLNVATTAGIIMYDYMVKLGK